MRGDVYRLPFPDRSFDAIFVCAVLQQVADPLRALVEARRVARSGAVIGVADADWGSAVIAPDDPWLDRGRQILSRLRGEPARTLAVSFGASCKSPDSSTCR